MISKLVGVSFTKFQNLNDKGVYIIGGGTEVKVWHDKSNKYSDRAIAVTYNDTIIGHIAEKGNEKHEEVFNILPLTAKVSRVASLMEGEEFGKFQTGEITSISIEFDMASDVSKDTKKSFNEDLDIKFLETEHEYWYNGTKLMGATTYIKKWIKPFDKDLISGFVAKGLGARQQEVLDIWGGTGNISADFGTVIHNALEHYENHKGIGKVMQEHKELPFNKALPTHPVLREIVESFYKLVGDGDSVEVEVLVSNVGLGLCGHIDRLKIINRDKKICRVQDYKINIDSDKIDKNITFFGQFADLPKNKLTKYRLQLSFYARLLELSGWTVEGLDAFVYEDEWKHYPMDVIKLDF